MNPMKKRAKLEHRLTFVNVFSVSVGGLQLYFSVFASLMVCVVHGSALKAVLVM